MGTIILGLQGFSAAFALASAFHWVRSARVRIPWEGVGTYRGPEGTPIEDLRLQAHHNAWAAATAAIAVIGQTVVSGMQAWMIAPLW